jgi:hypothetical protein
LASIKVHLPRFSSQKDIKLTSAYANDYSTMTKGRGSKLSFGKFKTTRSQERLTDEGTRVREDSLEGVDVDVSILTDALDKAQLSRELLLADISVEQLLSATLPHKSSSRSILKGS